MIAPTFNNLGERFIWIWYSHTPPTKGYVCIKGVWTYKQKWWHRPWFFWYYEIKNKHSYIKEMMKVYGHSPNNN